MAGDIGATTERERYRGRATVFVCVTCLVAASGGLVFGYDVGVSGGVTSMDGFLQRFFPGVYRSMRSDTTRENQYCKFDSQLLTSFTSSLYISGLVAAFFAAAVTRAFGRRSSILLGGSVFLLGVVVNAAAVDIGMLIAGRLLLGVGVGFANQSVPIYIAEMAPAQMRGALSIGFQLAITVGILAANLINFGTQEIKGDYGWRISVAMAAVPAVIMTVSGVLLPDTPNSLTHRGHREQARAMLHKIRGTLDVEEEFQALCNSNAQAEQVANPWKNIFLRKNRPQLVMAIAISSFQQFTGINVIMFYAPLLFKTLGFGEDASLMSAVITGLVNVAATFVAIISVDRFGRRILFLEGGLQMFVCQVLVGTSLGLKFGTDGTGALDKDSANFVLVCICFYVAAFAWSWGPMGWLIPSEIFSSEIRSVGQSITVAFNFFFTFLIGQLFLTALCHLKFALFYFFAWWELIMTAFIYFFLPETKNVPIEEMNSVWERHWFWGRSYIDHDDQWVHFPVKTTVP